MPSGNSLVLIYGSSPEAGGAVQVLLEAGFGPGEISVIGKPGSLSGVKVEDCKTSIPRIRSGRPEFWKEISAQLGECVSHELPDLGPVLIVGPMAAWMTVALANAAIFGGLDALGAVLHSLGVPRETIYQGETALKENSYLVVVHGPAKQIERAKQIVQELSTCRLDASQSGE